MRRLLCGLVLTALLAGPPAWADDEDALGLADRAPAGVQADSDWRSFIELGASHTEQRIGPASVQAGRLSLDTRYDGRLSPSTRLVFADRLDLSRQSGTVDTTGINTLKEAYVAWQLHSEALLDLGRINPRQGVAIGYNPTDYFKTSAVRSLVSSDPASLRENRLGSAMLRGQMLWTGGSATALVSPRLASQTARATFDPDFGATNHEGRWLIAVSQQLGRNITPQWLLFGGEQHDPQVGFNLSALLNDSTVAFAEWSGGRGPGLQAAAAAAAAAGAAATGSNETASFASRLAAGLTHTTASNLTITLEYEGNQAAPDAAGWSALRQQPALGLLQYLRYTGDQQDLAVRRAGFVSVMWQDAFIKHLDLSSYVRLDLISHSRSQWVEARYHWDHVDLALQLQFNSGAAGSLYGAMPSRSQVQALLRTYF